jgi:hypothetical protein
MEKKKPTIDEVYKINIDGLFESTANWFDTAFKKSQAEINRDLYNKINGYNSSNESTGGNVNLGPLLTSLNGSNLYPSKGYLYYNGDSWEFNTPTISGGGGVVDTAAIKKIVNDTINNVSWWGQKINNNKVDGSIVITKGTHSFTIELDNDGNLKFNGNVYATGGITALGVGTTSGGGNGASLGTLLTKLNSENPFPTANGQVLTYDGSNFVWKTSTGSGVTLNPTMDAMNKHLTKTGYGTPQFLYWDGYTYTWKNESEISGNGGSIQVAQTPEYSGESEDWVSTTKLRFVGITGTKPTIRTNSEKSCVDVGIPVGGGSGSSGTTSGKLRFYQNGSEEAWNGESDFKINFGSGLNVDWDTNHKYITLSAVGGSSTGGSVDLSNYLTKTEASRSYAAKSHNHSINDIISFTENVKAIKVNNATNADKATQLANPRTIWGQSFNGTNNINGNLFMGTAGGGSIQLYMNNGNMLDRTNNVLHIGYGLKESSDGEINLDANVTKIYTDNYSKHYDFKSNVFDVNSNQIHFGSETNGGKISWDAANNAFKIEGNVYATGGITALGVSNSTTTSNNVDFTFKSITADSATFDKLYLRKEFGYGLFVGTKCALWGAIETDAIHIGGNFTQVYMTEWIVINSNSKQCYCAARLQTAKGLSLLDGYLDVKYNGTTYKFDFAKAKELGLLTNTGVR